MEDILQTLRKIECWRNDEKHVGSIPKKKELYRTFPDARVSSDHLL